MVFSLNQILNVSPNLQIATYLKDKSSLPYIFSSDVEEHDFPSNCTKSYLKLGERLFSTVTWVLQLRTVWNHKDWPVDFAKLWSRESDSVYNHVP